LAVPSEDFLICARTLLGNWFSSPTFRPTRPIYLTAEENLISFSDVEKGRLTEAEATLRDLASQMRAFAQAERLAELIVRRIFNFNALEISTALIGYSNAISTRGQIRASFKSDVQKLLRIRAVD